MQTLCSGIESAHIRRVNFFSKLFKKNIGLAGHLRLVFTSVGVDDRGRRLRSAFDLVKTRLLESEAEAEG